MTGAGRPTVSVVVTNHNYAPYLSAALDSALGQTYPVTEVVVVDDGSTDGSREILAAYADQVETVLQEQQGESAAVNVGVARAQGELVCLLDSDDVLLPRALEEAVARFDRPDVTDVEWTLWVIDAQGRRTGELIPRQPPHGGALREALVRVGPDACDFVPNSGHLFHRSVCDATLPLPDDPRCDSDSVLAMVAGLMGRVAVLPEPMGLYRVHGRNKYAALGFLGKLEHDRGSVAFRCQLLAEHCRRLGLPAEPERWRAQAWVERVATAVAEIEGATPAGATVALLDDGDWGPAEVGGRHLIPFPSRDGVYWGRPADEAAAVEELERIRADGAGYLAITWAGLWWLEHYRELAAKLRACGAPLLSNDRLLIVDLNGRPMDR